MERWKVVYVISKILLVVFGVRNSMKSLETGLGEDHAKVSPEDLPGRSRALVATAGRTHVPEVLYMMTSDCKRLFSGEALDGGGARSPIFLPTRVRMTGGDDLLPYSSWP